MKKFLVTAAALTLGTSALAWAPADKAQFDGADVQPASGEWSGDKSALAFGGWDDKGATGAATFDKAGFGLADGAKSISEPASFGGAKMLADGGDAKLQMASDDSFAKDSGMAAVDVMSEKSGMTDVADAGALKDSGPIDMAEAEMSIDKTGAADVQTASWDGKSDAFATAGKDVAMGGPIEEAQGYPPCDPGPGDDRCIQLYEPGVRTALAQWKDSESDVAMGGPFEPAASDAKDDSAEHQGMDHGNMDHSSAAAAAGSSPTTSQAPALDDAGKPAAETDADMSAGTAKPADAGTTVATTPNGVGGPIDERSGYPPCTPGAGDDSCIQLYERGVTGQGN